MLSPDSQLVFHHVGVLVGSMEEAIRHYAALFGQTNISAISDIESQGVRVCFVKIGDGSYLELVEPMNEDSKVSRMAKKQVTYYHVGYMVKNIESAVSKMSDLNYKPGEYFASEAFGGKRCIFLFSPQAHLIELIEGE